MSSPTTEQQFVRCGWWGEGKGNCVLASGHHGEHQFEAHRASKQRIALELHNASISKAIDPVTRDLLRRARMAIEGLPAETSVEPFVVKHYEGDERPTIKGNGFDGLEVGEDRERAQEFVDWLNARLAGKTPVDWLASDGLPGKTKAGPGDVATFLRGLANQIAEHEGSQPTQLGLEEAGWLEAAAKLIERCAGSGL